MTAKEKLFKVIDKIDVLKSNLLELTNEEQNELENLEVKQMEYWSEWKD